MDNDDVKKFQTKMAIPRAERPSLLHDELLQFRLRFLAEELSELYSAAAEKDLIGMADALVDLVYVAHGTAIIMGLPWQQIWDEVHSANMGKERVNKAEDSKRGHVSDVVKPKGWKPPDLAKYIGEGPWPTLST